MKKYLHCEIGTAVTVSGMAVCLSAFFVHPFHMVAIGIIGTWFNGLIVDYFTVSLNKRKRVCIISEEYEKTSASLSASYRPNTTGYAAT